MMNCFKIIVIAFLLNPTVLAFAFISESDNAAQSEAARSDTVQPESVQPGVDHSRKEKKKFSEPTQKVDLASTVISQLPKGATFQHPKADEACQEAQQCQEVAAEYCLSKKARYLDCSEEYDDAWITTCECQ